MPGPQNRGSFKNGIDIDILDKTQQENNLLLLEVFLLNGLFQNSAQFM